MIGSRKPVNLRAVSLFVLFGTVGFLVATQVDRPIYRLFAGAAFKETDFIRMFRVAGSIPVWVVVGGAVALIDAAWRRGLLIAGSAALAGLVGEVLKLLIRAERPGLRDGMSSYRSWAEFSLSTSGFSTPSSHAIVAFSAAWILCRLYPRATSVWLLMASGCAVTRVISCFHVLSDVLLSAMVAYAVVWLIWRSRWGAPGCR